MEDFSLFGDTNFVVYLMFQGGTKYEKETGLRPQK